LKGDRKKNDGTGKDDAEGDKVKKEKFAR